jgi:hypothetical protein
MCYIACYLVRNAIISASALGLKVYASLELCHHGSVLHDIGIRVCLLFGHTAEVTALRHLLYSRFFHQFGII